MSSPDMGNSRSDFIPEPSASSLTYSRRGGCFVTRKQSALLALAFLGAIALAAAFGRYVWAPVVPEEQRAAARATAGTSASEHVNDERLPQDVLPVRYRLHLWPVLDAAPPNATEFTFQGRLALTVRVAEGGARAIALHLADSLTLSEEDVVVAEACPHAEALAEAWESFPSGAEAAEDGDGPAIHRIHVKEVTRDPAWDRLELRTTPRLAEDTEYIVFLTFNGTLGDTLSGLYRSSYVDVATKATKWLAVTHMQPTYARSVFPCMDEPGFRAPFRLSIATSNATSALANAALANTAPIAAAPGWRWHHFEESVAMPTYLVAFAVTDFTCIAPKAQQPPRAAESPSANTSTAASPAAAPSEVQVRLCARPSVLERGHYAVDMAPKLLGYYSDYFSVPYPLSKIDLLAVPDFDFGAMENWGLVIFREMHLLVDEAADGVGPVELVAETVAHELAHQWFGNLVTPAWWDELWLNEGFSEYIQFQAVDHVEPTWRMEDRFQTSVLQSAMLADASMATRAIAARLRSKHEIMQAFDTIAYEKGACIVRMLRHSLGDAAFRQGVADYMQRWQHNSTTESRLWEPLTDAVTRTAAAAPWHQRLPANLTVAQVMSTWTKTTGYPVVNVTRADGKIVFTQERFLGRAWQRNSSRPFSGPELWSIPLSLATQSEAAANASVLNDTRPRAWLLERTLELEHSGSAAGWLLVNMQQTGYFRVNYDLHNWGLLTAQLRTDPNSLPAAVRAQLLGDAFALAFAGQLPYFVALNLTGYLPARERSPQPWAAALSALGVIAEQLTGHPEKVVFERYMQRLLSPMWDRVAPADWTTAGLPSATSESHVELLHRAAVIEKACGAHVDKCEDWARRAVHLWRLRGDDGNSTVPVMLRAAAYCSAVATGSSDVWNFMWERYRQASTRQASDSINHANTILGALACTRDPARATFLLSRALDDTDIRQQDVSVVWIAAASAPVARLAVFPYLREHWPRIHAKFGDSSMVSSTVLTAAMLSLSSEADLQDLEAFRAKYNDTLGVASWSILSSAEDLRTAVEWRQNNLPAVRDWMAEALRNPYLFT